MQDALITAPVSDGTATIGPLEEHYLGSRFYRNVAGSGRITATHWHIAWANGLGWGFDGMDGAILALVAPLLMREFAIDLGTYRNGVQLPALISITVSISGRGWRTGSVGGISWQSTSPSFPWRCRSSRSHLPGAPSSPRTASFVSR